MATINQEERLATVHFCASFKKNSASVIAQGNCQDCHEQQPRPGGAYAIVMKIKPSQFPQPDNLLAIPCCK
jgi:hypothetical protein